MIKSERIKKLKELRVIQKDGPLFKSANDCMIWIDNVAPLLKYDQQHYYEFCEHAKIVRITNLTVTTLMPHLNAMIGIVNQAIIELENDIEPIKEQLSEELNPTSTPSDSKPPNSIEHKEWYQRPIGIMGLTIFAGIIIALAIHLIKKHLGIPL